MNDLGARLQKERENFGWSQSELARRMVDAGWASYTQMTVSRTERGEREPRVYELIALASIFGVGLEELIGGEESIASDLYAEGFRDGLAAAQKALADVRPRRMR